MNELDGLKNKAIQFKAHKELLEQERNLKDRELITVQNKAKTIETAIALIQLVAKETQKKLQFHLQDICNTALDAVFPGKYRLIVSFEMKRGRTEADIYLVDLESGNRVDPVNDNGGGLVDIVSFALRLSAWSLSQTDNVLIMDEPFKFLSEDLKPLAGEILKTLSQKLGLQVIMVTHDEQMINIADRVFNVIKQRGISKVEAR